MFHYTTIIYATVQLFDSFYRILLHIRLNVLDIPENYRRTIFMVLYFYSMQFQFPDVIKDERRSEIRLKDFYINIFHGKAFYMPNIKTP